MDTVKEPEKNEQADTGAGADASFERENETLKDEINARDTKIVKLEQEIKAKESEIAALKKELDELKQVADAMGKTIAQAVAAYQEAVIQGNPGLPAELITGDTIEAVKESVKNARAVVEKIRHEMEAEAMKNRIPAGAPQRLTLDLSGLSAREKIQYAIKGSSA